jgi:hypothetical protein
MRNFGFILSIVLLLAALPSIAQTAQCPTPNINFAWSLSVSDTGSPNPVTGYQIWGATTPAGETTTGVPVATTNHGVTSVSIPTPTIPGVYYFTATAAIVGPMYSPMSNEVSCSVGPAPPTGLGIK